MGPDLAPDYECRLEPLRPNKSSKTKTNRDTQSKTYVVVVVVVVDEGHHYTRAVKLGNEISSSVT